MNAELYSIRTTEEETSSLNGQLQRITDGLADKSVDLLYKTEVNCEKMKLLQAIKQSISSKDGIGIIVIANALDANRENVIFKTLCGLTANKNTVEKAKIRQLNDEQNDPSAAIFTTFDIGTETADSQNTSDDKVLYANAISLGNFGGGYNAYCFFCGDVKIVALPKESLTNVAVSEMVLDAVAMALPRTPITQSLLPEKGLAFEPEAGTVLKKKKKGFWSGIIPMRGDKPKEILRKVILILAVLTFLVTAGILLFQMVIGPMLNNKKNQDLRDIFYNSSSQTEDTTDPETGMRVSSHNWDGLLDINSQVVGWVTIPDTNIDYVVAQNEDDTLYSQKYLYKDIYGNYSGYGTILEDFRSKGGGNAKNIILHGHNMLDGSMFANLMHYGGTTGDLDFYQSHPIIEFDTPEYDADWEIISVYKTNTEESQGEFFNYLTGEFASDAEFMNYIYLVRARSLINTPVKVNEDDQIITLSTCSYEFSEFRTVVVARRMRQGEARADFSKATLNPNPLWPDIYYNQNGGTKPTVTSFKQAYKAGEIDWYDGSGNLTGRERKFTLKENDYVQEDTTASTTEDTTASEVTEAPPDETAAPTEPPEQVINDTQIWFNYSSMTMNVDDRENLSITWNPTNTTDKSVIWDSTDTSVATVSSTGQVTAVSGGTCKITARSNNGNVATCNIKVNKQEKEVTSVRIDYASTNVKVGTTFQLTGYITPSDADNTSLTWHSNNSDVATVNSDGVVTGVATGTATITAAANNGKNATCTITVY